MSNIRVEIFNGSYDNEDVYHRVLGYISGKAYIGGYGFNFNPSVSIIEQFRLSETYSLFSSEQKMWHFSVTFKTHVEIPKLLKLAVDISNLFAHDYQIFYGVDTTGHAAHLHFGVNVFSYHPTAPVLSTELIHKYMRKLQYLLTQQFYQQVIIDFK